MTMLLSFLLLFPSIYAHISMQYPHPRDKKNSASYEVWQQNEPMIGVHPTICHGLDKDSTVRDGNKFNVGDVIDIDLYGTAVHDGGHCSFWYSTDDVTFTKIIDVKDCTLVGAQVPLPAEMPLECEEKCTFAWTWTPRVSGLCEIYMNCADISVAGVTGRDDTAHPVSINFQTKFLDKGPDDLPHHYGCQRVDDVTHWTTNFGELLDTDGDWSDDNEHVVTEDPEEIDPIVDGNVVCYANPSMAINLDNEVDNNGACGSGPGDYRCDDGSCCGQYGFCGTTAEYCDNAQGDWRVTTCDGQTPTPTEAVTPTPTTAGQTPSPVAPIVPTSARFVSYIGQAGPGWGTPASNEEFLKVMSHNILNRDSKLEDEIHEAIRLNADGEEEG